MPSARSRQALSKMNRGALGGQSRAATPVLSAERSRRKLVGSVCMSQASGYVSSLNAPLAVAWPDCSEDGSAIVAYHVYDHTYTSVLGDDRLTLFTTRGPETALGDQYRFWQQQWFWGTRDASANDNFYHSPDPGDPPTPGAVILVSYSSDHAGASFAGIGNSVFQVRNYPDDYTSGDQTLAVTATSLLVVSAWGTGGPPAITLTPTATPTVSTTGSIEDHHLTVAAYEITGSYSVTCSPVGRLYAYSTFDARYVI